MSYPLPLLLGWHAGWPPRLRFSSLSPPPSRGHEVLFFEVLEGFPRSLSWEDGGPPPARDRHYVLHMLENWLDPLMITTNFLFSSIFFY